MAQPTSPAADPPEPIDEDIPPGKVINVYSTEHGTEARSHMATRNESIIIEVTDLEAWLKSAKVKKTMPPKIESKPDNLVPFINRTPLVGVTPKFITVDAKKKIHALEFVLSRNDENRDAWKALLKPRFTPLPVEVTVGFPGGWTMDTDVYPEAPEANQRFSLLVVPRDKFLMALGAILIAMAVFWNLARNTDIIRDVNAALRPDGRATFSLARSQMAFWFFLVISCYILLWITTGDKDTITNSVLMLIGISAGTALGAAVIDSGKAEIKGRYRYVMMHQPDPAANARVTELEGQIAARRAEVAQIKQQAATLAPEQTAERDRLAASQTAAEAALQDLEIAIVDARRDARARQQNNRAIVARLAEQLSEKREEFRKLADEMDRIPADQASARERKKAEQLLVEEAIDRLTMQKSFYSGGSAWRFLIDILGDNGVISFHRFQIFVWTIILGVIFLYNVKEEQAMPEFSATLLGLMGISAGTYVGFKVPDSGR